MSDLILKSIAAIFTIAGIVMICGFIYCLKNRSPRLDRMMAQGEYKTILLVLLLVLTFPLTLSGILFISGHGADIFMSEDAVQDPSLIWTMLFHSMDPGNQNMAIEGWPRMLVFVVATFGIIFFNGLLISSIVSMFERQINIWEKGLARYPKLLKKSNFITIIGSNEMVPSLLAQIFRRDEQVDYILIQTSNDIDAFRKHLASFLSTEDERRVILYSGVQTSAEDISSLCLEYTKEVFILGDSIDEDSQCANHDAINMKSLQIISEQLRASGLSNRKLVCRVMFEYQTSFSIFQFADISDRISSIIDFRPFNYYELWSQRIFVNHNLSFNKDELDNYLPLEGMCPITAESDNFVHLVIVGMSKMGVSMAIEAAHLAHYPNFNIDPNLKTRITFIDTECDKEMGFFKGRFKELFALSRYCYKNSAIDNDLYDSSVWKNSNFFEQHTHLGKDFIDVEWEFIKGGIETANIHTYLKDATNNSKARLTLALCLPQDNQNVAAALYLPDEVYEKAIQILVYQRHNDSIINSISQKNKINLYYKQLKAFGMHSDSYDDHMIETTRHIADILGDKYYEMYQKVNSDNDVKSTSRKNTRGKSKAAKQWSNIYNANSIWSKLRSALYATTGTIEEKDIHLLALTEHNRWVMEQLLMRFRALTEEEQKKVLEGEYDKEKLKGDKMAHLDICSFDRLTEVDPVTCKYDIGFIQIIPSILEAFKNK